jgi:hypothetical protein
MFRRRSKRDWREATRHLENLDVVELHWEEFPPGSDDELDWLFLEILDALEEAQKDGVRYIVFEHGPDQRPDVAMTTVSVTRLWITRAASTRPYVKPWSIRVFDEAVLAEIRPPRNRDARARYFQVAAVRLSLIRLNSQARPNES